MKEGTLTDCDHHWIGHYSVQADAEGVSVCAKCGASRKADLAAPVPNAVTDFGPDDDDCFFGLAQKREIEIPGVTTREQAERIARRAFPAPAAEDAEPVLSEATQKLLAEAMDAVARDVLGAALREFMRQYIGEDKA